MNYRCSICRCDDIDQVNRMIGDGVPDTAIAKRLGLSRDSIRRHRVNEHHLELDPKQPVYLTSERLRGVVVETIKELQEQGFLSKPEKQ